jgi:hypothetical protein
MSGQSQALPTLPFTLREIASLTHWLEVWVDPRTCMDVETKGEKSFTYWDSNSNHSDVQPVARCYTDCVIPGPRRKPQNVLALLSIHQDETNCKLCIDYIYA